MFYRNGRPQHISTSKLLLKVGLALLFTFIFFFPPVEIGSISSVHAQQSKPLDGGPSILSIKAGFNGTYRIGNWIPVQVKVTNNGGEFNGNISVSLTTLYTGNGSPATSISLYQTSISLPAISQKQITMYVPIETSPGAQSTPNSLTIHLQDNNNHEVTKKSTTINSVASNELYIGLISDQTLDVRQLTSALSGQYAHIHVEPLSAATLQTVVGVGLASALNNFDMLVLDNAVTSTLSNDQRTALQGWINHGGTFVEVGGSEWHSTLSSLPPSILPITITGTATVAAGQHLLLQQGKNTADTLAASVPVSVATPKPGSLVLLASNNIPLIVQANIGQGLVYYLAYDPFLEPLVSWTNTSTLWTNLLMRSLGDQVLIINNGNSASNSLSSSKYNLYGSINTFLESLVPNIFPSIWLILTLLISYVLILGPLRFLLIRWSKKKAWSWRIVLATIVVFSVLSYGLALQIKGTSIVSSNVSIIQLSQPDTTGSQAHVTNYVGVYVPSQGDFHVHMPGVNFVEPIDQSSSFGPYPVQSGNGQSSAEKTIITTQASSTDVDLQGVDTWTLRTLASKYDAHIQGGITSNLSLTQNIITGTITNTLPYTLNDAYLLVGSNYIALGKLESGQQRTVQITVNNQSSTSTQNNGGLSTLADQIASSKGVNSNTNYSIFNGNQPTDENYRHAAMLEALSGGNCNMGPCIKNYGGPQLIQSHLLDGPERGYSQDPLLIAGASATLVGWIDNLSNTNNITINNGTAPGTQENLLQAPLNLHFTGKIDTPDTLSTGQIVDVQPGPNSSNLPQAVGPGTYSLTTGSITFEIQLPVTDKFQRSALTFSEATALTKMGYINSGAQGVTSDANSMNIGLYNWQSNTWDSEKFNANTFSVNDAQKYIGPNGRVLIRFSNSQNAQNTAIFATPGVELTTLITG